MPATTPEAALAAANPSASSKSSLHPKVNTAAKKVPAAVVMGASASASSKKSSSHPGNPTSQSKKRIAIRALNI